MDSQLVATAMSNYKISEKACNDNIVHMYAGSDFQLAKSTEPEANTKCHQAKLNGMPKATKHWLEGQASKFVKQNNWNLSFVK